MSVSNGTPVSAEITNAAFLSKTTDSTTIAKITLANGDLNSGATIINTQRAINETFETVGIAGEGDAGRMSYASNEILVDGESHKEGLEKLDAEFSTATGHDHSGLPGSGGQISATSLSNFNQFWCEWASTTYLGASGASLDITTVMPGKVAGGSSISTGVITDPPENRCEILDPNTFTYVEDGEGQRVYGRITGSGITFQIDFFTVEAGVETPHTLATQDIRILFREIFDSNSRPTIPSNPLEFGTLDITADVVDATPSQRGVVSTGSQFFGGQKTFTDDVSFLGAMSLDHEAQTITGANQTLLAPTNGIVRLTGAGLTSIEGISISVPSQAFVLVNNTGGTVLLLNESGSPASEQIVTGSGGSFSMQDGACALVCRNDSTSRWHLVGGGGSITVGLFDTVGNADGLSISSGLISLHAADSLNPGGVSIDPQEFAGEKTFLDGADVQAGLKVSQTIAISNTTQSASGADYVIPNQNSVVVELTGSVTSIAGMDVPALYDGAAVLIKNSASQTISVVHDLGSVPADERFITPDGGNIELKVGESILVWHKPSTHWVVIQSPTDRTAPRWRKFQVSHTELQAASNSNSITLTNLFNEVVTGVIIAQDTAASGGALTDYSLSVGITGDQNRFSGSHSVFPTASSTSHSNYSVLDIPERGLIVPVKLFANSVGDTLDESVAGQFSIYLQTSFIG